MLKFYRSAGTIALLFLLTACSTNASTNAVPTPQPLYEQRFTSQQGDILITLDREVYPAHYHGEWHTHPGPGLFCTLTGTITMEVQGKPNVSLSPGTCWEEIPGTVHRPANLTNHAATAIFYLFAPAALPRIQPASSARQE